MPAPRCLDGLAWPQLAQAARQGGSTVLWPIGAFEQHGPQLPLGTDAIFADRVADAVLAGGVDVISHAPVTYKKRVIATLQRVQKAKGFALLQELRNLNPMDLLPSPPALSERYTGLAMGEHAEEMAQNFDWDVVAKEIFSVYEMALVGHEGVTLSSDTRGWSRFLGRDNDEESK